MKTCGRLTITTKNVTVYRKNVLTYISCASHKSAVFPVSHECDGADFLENMCCDFPVPFVFQSQLPHYCWVLGFL